MTSVAFEIHSVDQDAIKRRADPTELNSVSPTYELTVTNGQQRTMQHVEKPAIGAMVRPVRETGNDKRAPERRNVVLGVRGRKSNALKKSLRNARHLPK